MANEATVRVSLGIKADQIDYQSRPTAFSADVSGRNGPTPGAISVSTAGTDVSFAQLSTPGLCFIHNLDGTYAVEIGVYDASAGKYYPMFELMPGEAMVCRLSRYLGTEQGTTGTASVAGTDTLRLKGIGGSLYVSVEAFER